MLTLALLWGSLGQSPVGPDLLMRAPRGFLLLTGAESIPAEAENEFLSKARAGKNHLVVIPSALANETGQLPENWKNHWKGKVDSLAVLHARSRNEAMNPAMASILEDSSAVWIMHGQKASLLSLYAGTPVQAGLEKLVNRGGAVGGEGAGAEFIGAFTIDAAGGRTDTRQALALLPRLVVGVRRQGQEHNAASMPRALKDLPGHAGIVLGPETAVVIHGRDLRVVGSGKADWLPSRAGDPRSLPLPAGTRDDLIRLHRSSLGPPPIPRGKPILARGAVMAVGGGGMGPDLAKRFINLAGGPKANIVILPTAAPESSPVVQGEQATKLLSRGGEAKFQVLASTTRQDVESGEYLTALDKATGVWFGGGRQWRFLDAYEGTRFEEALGGVLNRGGVIGGSSAGATILGDYLCRGGPLGNTEMMVPGYDRGFAFIKGVGIDQHFSQRKRFADMERFTGTHPDFTGVGIDEATALIVTPRGAEAMGPGKVHVYSRGKLVASHASGESVRLNP